MWKYGQAIAGLIIAPFALLLILADIVNNARERKADV